MPDLSALTATESRNPRTATLDAMSVTEFLEVMNAEDHRVADAVAVQIPQIARAVDLAVAALRSGGRLIYTGAEPELVIGLLAGGQQAMFQAVEGAEDSAELGVADLVELGLTSNDVVVGIAASGRTPYVIGGLDHAREVGAATGSLACNPGAEVGRHADVSIEVDNGPEVLTGSTRLKAGTSQKLSLNMISTAAMVRLGKVYGNLMVDVRPSNEKLVSRAIGIIQAATGCEAERAAQALADADNHAKTAIVAILCDVDTETARSRLADADGFVRAALTTTSEH